MSLVDAPREDPSSRPVFPGLGPAALEDLAAALAGGRLRLPATRVSLRRHVAESVADEVVRGLAALPGFTAEQVAVLLRALAVERRDHQRSAERLELVWSGPDAPGTAPRDTAVVIRGLCEGARRSVLIANYSFDRNIKGENRDRARALWQPLADVADANPAIHVRIFANVERHDNQAPPKDGWVNAFRTHFCEHLWPGRRLPELYYDPRSLDDDRTARAILHAKCVIVDETQVFLTSANFTQAGQQRNIEAGFLLTDAGHARALTAQFDALVAAGVLLPIIGR